MLITVEITSASEFHAALNVLAIVPKIYIYFFLVQIGFSYIMYN